MQSTNYEYLGLGMRYEAGIHTIVINMNGASNCVHFVVY